MKITFEKANAYRPRPGLGKLSRAGWFAGVCLVLVASMIGIAGDPMSAVIAFVVALLAIVAAQRVKTVPTKATVEPLAAAREGLYEGERLILSRDSVRAAIPAVSEQLGPILVLISAAGVVRVSMESEENVYRLEQALQLDAEHRRTQVLYAKPMGSAVVAIVVLSMLAFVVFGTTGRDTSLLAVLALSPMFAVVFWRTVFTIGDDGVSLRTLGRERFIAYSGIESMHALEAADPDRRFAPRIILRSGKELKLDRPPEFQTRFGIQIDEVVLERAQDALERYRRRAARAPVLPLSLSAQSTGSPADRVRALAAREHGGDAYRRSATDDDALRRAVDEPTLSPRLRAEAALMLAVGKSDDDLERIRRAAERSACRPLRDLFEAVVDGAVEAKLARALGRVG